MSVLYPDCLIDSCAYHLCDTGDGLTCGHSYECQYYLSIRLLRTSLRIHNTPVIQAHEIPRIMPASKTLALYDIELTSFAEQLLKLIAL